MNYLMMNMHLKLYKKNIENITYHADDIILLTYYGSRNGECWQRNVCAHHRRQAYCMQ